MIDRKEASRAARILAECFSEAESVGEAVAIFGLAIEADGGVMLATEDKEGNLHSEKDGKFTKKNGKSEAWHDEVVSKVSEQYPNAAETVDGRKVGEIVEPFKPGKDLKIFRVLEGVREFPLDAIDDDRFYAADPANVDVLAKKIAKSKMVTPIEVVIGSRGPQIGEGNHRIGALKKIGAKSFPAVIILDLGDFEADRLIQETISKQLSIVDPVERPKESHHYIIICSCGQVIAQCRCMDEHKDKQVVEKGCVKCKEESKLNRIADVQLSWDIFNRKAQGILNRAMQAQKQLSDAAKDDLSKALKAKDPSKLFTNIRQFLMKYRGQLADLLTTTQLASLLEGAREVAKDIPIVPMFPAALPPATLEPVEALALVDEVKAMTPAKQEERIYKLPADQQQFVRQGLIAEQQGPAKPPTFVVETATSGPEKIQFPIIDEAAKELSGKNVLTRPEYDRLDAAARQKAFTVAGVMAEETLTKIRDVLGENIREGASYETFREAVLDAVSEGTFMSDAHMETVFRTNVQTAFSDGQMAVLNQPFVRSGFPYARYDAIHDDRVRHEHLEVEKLGIGGTNIFRVNDPVLQMFRPPWDFNCRCSWRAMTVKQAAREGIAEAQQWLDTGIEPQPPAFVAMPSFRPPAGFQRSLNAAPLSVQLSVMAMDLPEIKEEQKPVETVNPPEAPKEVVAVEPIKASGSSKDRRKARRAAQRAEQERQAALSIAADQRNDKLIAALAERPIVVNVPKQEPVVIPAPVVNMGETVVNVTPEIKVKLEQPAKKIEIKSPDGKIWSGESKEQ